jgi:hypothetical protein
MNINQFIAPGASLKSCAARALNGRLRTVWRGHVALGFVWDARPGFKAYSRAGEVIGEFPDQQSAEAAVRQAVQR